MPKVSYQNCGGTCFCFIFIYQIKTLWGEVYFQADVHLIVKLELDNNVKIAEFPIKEKVIKIYARISVSE